MDLQMILVFGSMLAAAVLDVVLALTWSRTYFTVGIPLFVRRIHRPAGIADLPLEAFGEQPAPAAGPLMLFKRLGPDVVAFRERVFSGPVHYLPLMHGVIRYDAAEGLVRVAGLLNLTAIAFAVGFTILLGRGVVQLLPTVGIVFGVIYLVQSVRYNRVAKNLDAALAGPPPAVHGS